MTKTFRNKNPFCFQKVDPEVVFTKQERIGKGSFGEVFKGIDNRTQQVNENLIDHAGFRGDPKTHPQKTVHGRF